jgi:putative flavoprotein involved in K+ transport
MPANHPFDASSIHDVIVVGAGAAGVGLGVTLRHAGVENVLIVERHRVGATFDRWPGEMTFLTPSFPTNSIGMLDLNAIAIGTSPAHSLVREHPTGAEYAEYLRAVARYFKLPVREGVNVESVSVDHEGFTLPTNSGVLRSRFLVWAAGEFQYPRQEPFPGAEFCRHTSTLESYRGYPHEEALIIGGYESGIDAAIQLAFFKKKVTVLGRQATWEEKRSDPSVSLSTHTRERLETIFKMGGELTLVGGADVIRVERDGDVYRVTCRDGHTRETSAPPLLATGFSGSHWLIRGLYEFRSDGYPLLNERDESTWCPGLFLAGPMVRHDEHIFCFIYKFRQRFAVVAKTIAERLGLPADELETYRDWGMYLDDLSCCGEECVC